MSDQKTLRILYVCDDDAIRFSNELMLQEARYEVTWLPSNGDFRAANMRGFNIAILCQSVDWKRAASISAWLRRLHPTIHILRVNTLRSQLGHRFDVDCELVAGTEALIGILDSLSAKATEPAVLPGDFIHGPVIQLGRNWGSAEKFMSMKPKILIADDEPVIANTLATILNQGGFEARAVYSGEKALEVAASFAPDMLVSDVIMVDLNGIETAILMRQLLPRIKILLFSGRAASADLLQDARTRGYEFDLIAKPVHPKDLIRKLQDSGIELVPSKAASAETQQNTLRQQWLNKGGPGATAA